MGTMVVRVAERGFRYFVGRARLSSPETGLLSDDAALAIFENSWRISVGAYTPWKRKHKQVRTIDWKAVFGPDELNVSGSLTTYMLESLRRDYRFTDGLLTVEVRELSSPQERRSVAEMCGVDIEAMVEMPTAREFSEP
mgnify:CR=1 FL=1|jgi:hypothetical protein